MITAILCAIGLVEAYGALKIAGAIDASWWWLAAPVWGLVLLFLLAISFGLVLSFLWWLFAGHKTDVKTRW